jgi:hypothetical protein
MANFDMEAVMLDIKNLLADLNKGVNAQITAINADKATTDAVNYSKTITLKTIDTTNAVYFLVLNYQVINFDPVIGIFIDSKERDERGAALLKVSIKIAVLDPADGTVDVRALRYIQALENIFDRTRFFGGITFSIWRQLEAQIAIDKQTGRAWREIGIQLETALAMW